MSDIGSGIVGSFNQAHQASRHAESENARARRSEQSQAREARQRFIAAQEAVEAAQTLRQRRIDPDKDNSAGRDARDQYEAHDELTDERRRRQDDAPTQAAANSAEASAQPPGEPDSNDNDSGHLIDLKA